RLDDATPASRQRCRPRAGVRRVRVPVGVPKEASVRIVDVDPVADRAGWLKRRRDGLGGSDVAKVLGISGFGSPWSVYVEKIGAVEPDSLEPTDQQVRGRYLEDGVLAWYADETGFTVGFKQAMIVHPEHEWAFCTVDG